MAKKKTGELVRFGAYLRPDQMEALRRLNADTRIPITAMVESGVDRELEARGAKVKGARHGR